MTAKYNVVFVGKTGVGKSALINYLYCDKIMKIGVEKPVTQRGFHYMDNEINGLPVRFFDSWGLETGKEQEWLGLLDEELKKRDTGKPAEEWFHSVFYCIVACILKVEDFDIQIIKRFIDEKYKVSVILTMADLISEEDEEKLRNTVHNDLGQAVPVIPVCSVEKKLRGGMTTEKFGKEAETMSFINKEFEKLNTIIQELQHTLEIHGTFVQHLGYPPPLGSISNSSAGCFTLLEAIGLLKLDDKWWISFLLPLLNFPAHLIYGARNNKKELLENIRESVSEMNKRLPEIERGIKKALENLKEESLF